MTTDDLLGVAATTAFDRLEDLDNLEAIAAIDRSGYHRLLERLPEQAREAWALGQSWPLPPGFRRPSRVFLLGVGGSAIGADIVATLARLHGSAPVEVVRQYTPPATDADTLVIACSFSGNTEETIAAFEATLGTPGMRIAFTAGGRLAALARERGVPLISYAWDGPPRTALGYGLFTLLAVLARLRVIEMSDAEAGTAIGALADAAERYGLRAPMNAAKRLAIAIGDRLPVIIGADFLEVVARRFATEVSENAKQWAFSAALPEFNHNAMQAIAGPTGTPSALVPIILDAPSVHPRNRRRVHETVRMLAVAGVQAHLIDGGGETPFEAILRATSFASWTSFYQALLRGVDPTPTGTLDAFKERMARD